MSNPDLVPFDIADIDLAWQEFAKPEYGTTKAEQARAWNKLFGGKPRPPRTHAVTVAEVESCFRKGHFTIALQDLLHRRFSHQDDAAVVIGRFTANDLCARINKHFGLTPAPETDDEKWERLRSEGLSRDESIKIIEALLNVDNCAAHAAGLRAEFRKVLGIGEAGA